MNTLVTVASLRKKYKLLSAMMAERMRRYCCVAEALALPRGVGCAEVGIAERDRFLAKLEPLRKQGNFVRRTNFRRSHFSR